MDSPAGTNKIDSPDGPMLNYLLMVFYITYQS